MKEKLIKTLIADDQKMFLDVLASYLKEEKELLVTTATGGNQAIKYLKEETFDVAVLDIEMPDKNGIEVSKFIKQNYPSTKILILSMYNERDFVIKLMSIGVNGYILKNKSKEELVNAIHNLYDEKPHFGLEILNTLAKAPQKAAEKLAKFTPREEQVLILVAEGLRTKDIGQQLKIKSSTVSSYRKNLLEKTDCENDNQLVRYAIRHGYIKA